MQVRFRDHPILITRQPQPPPEIRHVQESMDRTMRNALASMKIMVQREAVISQLRELHSKQTR